MIPEGLNHSVFVMHVCFCALFLCVCPFLFVNAHVQVSADTTKKKIHALSMELMEARNKSDAKDKVGYVYISAGHVIVMLLFCVIG